jgi:hypothetical protein
MNFRAFFIWKICFGCKNGVALFSIDFICCFSIFGLGGERSGVVVGDWISIAIVTDEDIDYLFTWIRFYFSIGLDGKRYFNIFFKGSGFLFTAIFFAFFIITGFLREYRRRVSAVGRSNYS